MKDTIGYYSMPFDFDPRDDRETRTSKATIHNNKIKQDYFGRVEECEQLIQKYMPKVYSFNNSIEDDNLLLRQLSQTKGAYETIIGLEMDQGCTINDEDNGIAEIFDSMVVKLKKKIKIFKSFIDIVKQNIKKNSVHGANFQTGGKDKIFNSELLGRLHDNFYKDLFDDTLEEFSRALNNPAVPEFKLKITRSKSRIYHFIHQLHLQSRMDNFGKLMCIKQGFNFDVYNKKKNTLNNSAKDREYLKKINQCLK